LYDDHPPLTDLVMDGSIYAGTGRLHPNNQYEASIMMPDLAALTKEVQWKHVSAEFVILAADDPEG